MAEELSDQQTLEVIRHVEFEIADARRNNRVISRQDLARYASQKTGIPTKKLFDVVDIYCDEQAPGIPGYLSKAVEKPFLKIFSVVNAILLIASCLVGVALLRKSLMAWPAFLLAGIFLIFAVVMFWRSDS